MIELPAALASWKPALAAFAPDLAVALAPFVDRIALAIGPLSTTTRAGAGEPDGYGGLARRGSYERLVGSEWLLAQELPDEFIRRAGAGEHLFIEIATRVSAGGRRCVALFDAGPMQLGGPRIGHLATLIALSQRADRAATRFSWGIVQQPDAEPIEDVTEASILRLLHGRTSEVASSEHVDRWREKLALAASDEVWLVGDGSLEDSRGSRIAVHESIEVGARRVSIAVKRRDGRAAEVVLDLPAHDDCARLLRDPFSVVTATPQPSSQLGSAPSSNPVYGQDGRRVVVRLRDGAVACLPVPSSPRQTAGTPTIFRPREGEVVVAAGSHGKKLAVVTVDRSARVVVLRSIGKGGGVGAEKRFGPLPDEIKLPVAGAALGQCIRVGRGLIGADFVLCTDGERQLFHLSAGEPVWGPQVEALTLQGARARYLAAGGNPRRRRIWQWESDVFKPVGPSFDLVDSPAAFFGWGGTQWREVIALPEGNGWHVGYCDPNGNWRDRQLHPSAGERVVGVTSSGVDGCLVLLDEDRRNLSLVSVSTSKVLPRSSSEIEHVTVSDRRPELAYVTVDGELVVVHTGNGEALLRFLSGADVVSAAAPNRVRPRQLLHRGVVSARGWLLQGEWLDEAEVRRRALSLWEPGCQLYEVSTGLLLRVTRPRSVDCARAFALPLTGSEGVLYATSLHADERTTLNPPTGSVVLVQSGEAFAETLVRPIDPAEWLSLDDFEMRAVEAIAVPATPPLVITEPTPVIDRARLATTIGAPPDEMSDVAQALSNAARGEHAGERATTGVRGESWRVRLSRWGRRARAILSSLAASASTSYGNRARPTWGAPSPLWAALRRLFARAIYWSRLGRLLGRRQAAYLAEMMDLLRRGELEGLRRAIPLSSDATGGSSRPALGLPSRREGLEISLARRQPAAGYALANELFGEIRTLYHAVFARLVREGRIDEAAFVLAELLRSSEEAVAFLEQHGRYQLAAELAESRDLPAGLVVRQWFLAKDIRRAIRIAEERGAFADAVARLERTHRPEAQVLRMLWAERLASRGDYGSAVEVAWPITEARRLVGGWIDRAMDVGGVVAARLLVRRLQVVPTEFDAVRERAVELLSDTAPAGLAERRALLTALGEAQPARELAPLARLALRAQLRDAARFGGGGGQKKLRELLMRQAADGALRADLPPLPASLSTAAARIDIAALDRGTLAIHDVLRLPSGNLLVALGELGVRLLRPDGRVIVHFDMPAHALVGSDHGDRALTLAARGESVRVGRIDLVARRAQPWTELRVRSFARGFDGATWFVADETAVTALDVEGEQARARWRVHLVEGIPMRLTRDANNLSFAVVGTDGAELWTYELPQMVLRSRRPIDGGAPIGVAASGSSSACLKPCSENPAAAEVLLASANVNAVLTNPVGQGVPELVDIGSQWHAAVFDVGESMAVHVYKASASTPTHSITLAGTRRAQVRFVDETLVVGDELGRLVAVHAPTGSVICDLRAHLS